MMQSWKIVFLVFSLTLPFSHAANQTTEIVQSEFVKGNADRNKNISIPELTNDNEASEKVLNLPNNKETIEKVDEKNQNQTTGETQFKLNKIVNGSRIVEVMVVSEDITTKIIPELLRNEEATENIINDAVQYEKQSIKKSQFKIQETFNDTGEIIGEVDNNKSNLDLLRANETVKRVPKQGNKILIQIANQTKTTQKNIVSEPAFEQPKYNKEEIAMKVLNQNSELQNIVNDSKNYSLAIKKINSMPQHAYNKEAVDVAPNQVIRNQDQRENRKKLHKLVTEYGIANEEKSVFKQPNDDKNSADTVHKQKNKIVNSAHRLEKILKRNRKHYHGRNKEKDMFVQINNHGNNKVPKEEPIKILNEFEFEQSVVVNPKGNRPKQSQNFLKKNLKNPNKTSDTIEDMKFEALKKELVASIMNKTSALVIKLTRNRDLSDEERARVLILIKEKVLNKVSPLSERYVLWTDVITKGVDATFAKLRLLSGKSYRRKHNSTAKVTQKIPFTKYINEPSLKTNLPNNCEVLIQKACTKIISLNSLVCDSGNKSVTMEKLCDGFYDCEDGSDEVKCSDKAKNKLKQAEKLVEEAESSKFMDCFKNDESYLGKKKSESLRNVVARQISLITHCIDSPLVQRSIKGHTRDRMILEQGSHQIATVISSVSLSLDGAICTELIHNDDDYEVIMKRVDEHEDFIAITDDHNDEEWSHKSCQCSGKICIIHPCHEHCKKVCNHKHSLGQMICRSFSRDTSISLDLICDGKIDCEDESDEKDCNEGNSYARFQGYEAFGRVGQLIQVKIHSQYYIPTRGQLFKLQTAVSQLQKLTANLAVDKKAIKAARNKAFELLGSVYVEMLTKVSSFNETEKIFDFLMSLHDELIRALKHSHTGNDRLIPTEDCSCRGTYCNVPFCPAYCVKACSVEPMLTTLTCKNQPDVKVDVDHICDGTNDCPSGDDEKICDKGMCRKHHFILLHSRLKEISTGKDQNLLSEVLKTWKKKAITTARTSEVAVISSRENYKLVVKKILHDLVMAYTFTDEIKGDPQQLFNAFYNISQQVVKLVDYCGTY